jgi:tetratricopeptide (TPR) repeat protein
MSKIAIDFGTTRTKIARYDEQEKTPRLVNLGREQRWSIPCLFYIPKEGNILIGDDAQDALKHDPVGIVRGLKMDLHKAAPLRVNNRKIDRIDLVSLMFNWIRERCNELVFHNDPVNSCILTVPPSFKDFDISCIKKAAKRGGFDQIEIIDEPVAAARHWLVSADAAKDNKYIIVCDIGGGTSDIALVQKIGDGFSMYPNLPPKGIPQGGSDIDELIFQELEIDGIPHQFFPALLVRVKQAKEELTRRPDLKQVRFSFSDRSIIVSRHIAEKCSTKLVDRVISTLDRLADNASRSENLDIKAFPLLLVGGGRNIAGLKDSLDNIWSNVYAWEESEQATVLGASIPGEKMDVPNEKKYIEILKKYKPLSRSRIEIVEKKAKDIDLEENIKQSIETHILGHTIHQWKYAARYCDEAAILFKDQDSDLEKVIEKCNTSIQFYDKFEESHYLKAVAFYKKKKYEDAIQALSGKNRETYFFIARCHMHLKKDTDYIKAHEYLTRAIDSQTNAVFKKYTNLIKDYQIYELRAYASYKSQNYDACISDLYRLTEDNVIEDSAKAILWATIGKICNHTDAETKIESYKRAYEAFASSVKEPFAVNIWIDEEFAILDDWRQWFQSISIRDDFLNLLDKWLFDAICRKTISRGSLKEYFDIISEIDGISRVLSDDSFIEKDFDFLLNMASINAEYGNTVLTGKCLKILWEYFPDTEFWRVVKDNHIKSIIEKTNISPKIGYKLLSGVFNKGYRIKNLSVYDVHNVEVKLEVAGKNGDSCVIINKIKKMKPDQDLNLKDYLPGIDIQKYKVDISCSEMKAITNIQMSHPLPADKT